MLVAGYCCSIEPRSLGAGGSVHSRAELVVLALSSRSTNENTVLVFAIPEMIVIVFGCHRENYHSFRVIPKMIVVLVCHPENDFRFLRVIPIDFRFCVSSRK